MEFALTTRWNAGRHTSGEAMLQEILELGFTHVELGFDLRADLVEGVRKMAAAGTVRVDSLHNFCPLPVGVSRATPEIYTFTDPVADVRAAAVRHTEKTIRFAAELGARCVVAHAGYVDMPRLTNDLLEMYGRGEVGSPVYEKTKQRLLDLREKGAARHIDLLRRGMDELLPVLDETGVTLALELLPWWEAVPTGAEMETLLRDYNTPRLRCWYDVGHAQIRENLMQVRASRWQQRLQPFIAGYHLHDALPPAQDHLMPPQGRIDFGEVRAYLAPEALLVMEPAAKTPAELVKNGLHYFQKTWSTT